MPKRTPKKSDTPAGSGISFLEAPPKNYKGVQRLVWVDPTQLNDNPQNWRRHPRRQTDALQASLDANGWAGALLYNLTTNRLIDGHARKSVRKGTLVPVLLGNWTEEEERRILSTLDPISAMAETDAIALRRLMEETTKTLANIEVEHQQALKDLNQELLVHAESVEFGGDSSLFPSLVERKEQQESQPVSLESKTKDNTKGMTRLKTKEELDWDAWGDPSLFGIPYLRTDRLGSVNENIQTWIGAKDSPYADSYFYTWGSSSFETAEAHKFTVGFYTEDTRFECVWDNPEVYTGRMLDNGISSIVSPNFSIYDGTPEAIDIYQTFRSRWLSRYFQEAGMNVIPDLMLGNLAGDNWKWRFAGIPIKCPCVSLQVHQHGTVDEVSYFSSRKFRLVKALELLQPKSLIVYHGNLPKDFLDDLPGNPKIIKVRSWMNARREIIDKTKTLHRSSKSAEAEEG